MQISAVIITKNEEKNIGRCLDSLSGVVDEIVVVDSFSTDNTRDICNGRKVTFVKRKFSGFSNAKNFGNNLATHSWILSLDADEELSETLKESIREVKKNPTSGAYCFNRKTNYCGRWIKHCGWYPDRKLRLWRKELGEWQGVIHEELNISKEKVKWLPGDILHYSYPDISSHISQINFFTDLMARDLVARSKRVSVFRILLSPSFKFLKKYFLQRGFLDGYYGFVISLLSMYYTFLKYAKARELRSRI